MMLQRLSPLKSHLAIISGEMTLTALGAPPPVKVIVGDGVAVAAETAAAGKFKKPPRRIKEVLEEMPVPG